MSIKTVAGYALAGLWALVILCAAVSVVTGGIQRAAWVGPALGGIGGAAQFVAVVWKRRRLSSWAAIWASFSLMQAGMLVGTSYSYLWGAAFDGAAVLVLGAWAVAWFIRETRTGYVPPNRTSPGDSGPSGG